MTITALKNKIVAKLKELSIDDYYFDPKLRYIKGRFKKEFGGDSDEKIKEYLISRFPETFDGGIELYRKEELDILLAKIDELNTSANKIKDSVASKLNEKEKAESTTTELTEQENTLKTECDDLNKEIEVFKSLEGKSKYENQIKELNDALNEKAERIKQIPQLRSNKTLLLKSLDNELLSLEKQLIELNAEIAAVQNAHDKILMPFGNIENQSANHYKQEKESHKFLCKLLLRLEDYEEYYYKSRSKYKKNRQADEGVESMVRIESNDEYSEFMKQFFYQERILPDDWNKILIKIIESPIPAFEGNLYVKGNENGECIVTGRMFGSSLTLSCLLSLKMGLFKNQYIECKSNTVLLYLSGGISASITFREVSKLVEKKQDTEPNFYFLVENSKKGVDSLALYYQSGIAESEIQICILEGFYIIYNDYIITISFEATPILIESNNPSMMVSNNAPMLTMMAAAIQQKLEEKEEEERQRLMDDDD
jgi:hypothetical protein